MKKKIFAIAMSLIMTVTIMPQMSINAEAKTNYKRLYGRYLKSHPIESDFSFISEWKGTFIYIDKDSIPELCDL